MNPSVLTLCLLAAVGGEPNPCRHPGIFGAVDIVKAYRNNQAYAAEFIEGKEIQVSGRMLKLSKLAPDMAPDNVAESYAMLLSPDGKPPKDIALTFIFEKEDRCKLSQTFPGQYLRVRGTFYEVVEDPATGVMEVKFRQCRLAN